MKRILFGILWFIVSWIVLTVIYGIIFGIVVSSTSNVTGYHQGMQAGLAFSHAHPDFAIGIRLVILVLAILIAVIGTWKRVLPGTRKKLADTATVDS